MRSIAARPYLNGTVISVNELRGNALPLRIDAIGGLFEQFDSPEAKLAARRSVFLHRLWLTLEVVSTVTGDFVADVAACIRRWMLCPLYLRHPNRHNKRICVYKIGAVGAVMRLFEAVFTAPGKPKTMNCYRAVPLRFSKLQGEKLVSFYYQYGGETYVQQLKAEWAHWSVYDLLLMTDAISA